MRAREIRLKHIRHHWEIYLFIIPVLLMVGLFQYYPAATGIFRSLYRWNGFDITEFNFFLRDATIYEVTNPLLAVFSPAFWRSIRWDTFGGNYRDLLGSSDFWSSFRIAFVLGAFNVLKMIPALAVAVCIHRCRSPRIQFIYRILFVIPMVIPGLVLVLIWRSFFFEATSGYLNRFLVSSGIINVLSFLDTHFSIAGGAFAPDPLTGAIPIPAWLGDPRLILVACIVWGFPWVGSFAVLMHLAKLGGIGREIYEASELDGASWWGKFRHIELPLIGGSIYVLLVFVIIETIRDAGMILALAGMEGGPGGVVTVPALFMLRKAFIEQRMGYACAVGIILTAVVMSLQKVTTVWMSRDALPRSQWRICQGLLLLGTAVLILLDRFHLLAGVLVLLAFPYKRTIPFLCVGWLYMNRVVFGEQLREFALKALRAAMPGSESVQELALRYTDGEAFTLGDIPARLLFVLAILFATLPYGIVGRLLMRNGAIRQWVERYREGRERRRAEVVAATRGVIQVPTRFEQAKSYMLRGAKHATIWGVLLLAFLPVYLMAIVSVKDNSQFYKAPASITQPYHWENWRDAWERVAPSVANSILISTTGTAAILALALCGAYFFARLKMPLSGFFWNAILILMMMPTIANLVPLFRLLSNLNLLNTLTALILVSASAGQIAGIFVLRNFMVDIPQDLFEAAEIDGASHFRQLVSIVVPLCGPIAGTVGVMQFMVIWNDFVLPLIVMRDHVRLPVMVQLLRMNGEYIKLWGPLMAGYAFASIPVIVLFAFTMRLFVRGLTEGAVKN